MKQTVIYGLIDPRNGQLRYVGKTIVPLSRRLGHHIIKTSLTPKRHSCRWVAGVVSAGLKPEIFEIETVAPEEDWQAAERFWIEYFRFLGARLTNITIGGEGVGGYRFPEERRRYLSEKFKGREFDERWRANISKAKKGKSAKPKTPEEHLAWRKNMSVSQNARYAKSVRTHCGEGHPLSGDNLITYPGKPNRRECLICKRKTAHAKYRLNRPALKTPEQVAESRRQAGIRRSLKNPKPPIQKLGHKNGEDHHNAKLTWTEVDEIRRLVSEGKGLRSVAKLFGVARANVRQISQGKTWRPDRRPKEPAP